MYHLTAISRPEFLQDPALQEDYRGKRVLVLGGDGFLGSHIASALYRLGAAVSILSRRESSPLQGVPIQIHRGHLMQREVLVEALSNQEIVFDLAGSSGTVDSNQNSLRNLAIECEPHLNAFQVAAQMCNPPLVVFCSSRTVYGRAQQLPVSETHPLAPGSVYAIHKLTLEFYLQTFANTRGMQHLIFRLSNPYGPEFDRKQKTYGILNQFIGRAFQGEPISLFGDGSQKRDYIFIDNVVEAFVKAAVKRSCYNQVFNLGGGSPISMREAVELLIQECPGSDVRHEPWPVDHLVVETGDYATDLSKLRQFVSLAPPTTFVEGIRRTLGVYRTLWPATPSNHKQSIVTAPAENGQRAFPEKSWNWEGKRVLVTGASGFLGQVLLARLLRLGARVAAVHRKPLDAAVAAHSGLLSLHINLDAPERLTQAMKTFHPEVIYHLAARPDGPERGDHPLACLDTNVSSTITLLEMAREHAVSAFVFADTSKVYGNSPLPHREDTPTDPQSSYAASKLAAWSYCRVFARVHDLPVVALRPTLIYGPAPGWNLFAFLAKCLRAEEPEVELDGGLQTRDPLYLEDAVNAYLRAAELARRLQGRAIPIGGGHERTVQELAEMFVAAAGRITPIRVCGHRVRSTEMVRSYCDNVDAWAALRWQPTMPLTKGLRLTADFLLGAPPVESAQIAGFETPAEPPEATAEFLLRQGLKPPVQDRQPFLRPS